MNNEFMDDSYRIYSTSRDSLHINIILIRKAPYIYNFKYLPTVTTSKHKLKI